MPAPGWSRFRVLCSPSCSGSNYSSPMSSRQFLQELAHDAMRDRGFEPDFSQAAQAQVARLRGPAAADGRRDLRDLPWCSIDNDDSRDLDQLSVADASSGPLKLLVAIAHLDSLV